MLASMSVRNDRISDHSTVFFELNGCKPPLPKKVVYYRKLKAIDIESFKKDIVKSGLPSFTHTDLDVVVHRYNEVMSSVLEKHAALKKRIFTIHPDAAWITDKIKDQKRKKRCAEHKWRDTGLTVHQEIYMAERNNLNHMIEHAKKDFYQNQISESGSKQRTLFKCADELLNKKKLTALPNCESLDELCNRFATFFQDKIRAIHDGLKEVRNSNFPLDPDPHFAGSSFDNFDPVTEDHLAKIINSSASKSCCLDPVPTSLVKDCLDILIPLIARIVNQSFEQGYVPQPFKIAAVTPLLKKADLVADILKHFRPISNLPYLSKVLERAANKQLIEHKESNNLRDSRQSAYRKFYSTETALLRINHDLLMARDKRQCTIMCLLDLSAAFDTVSHEILLRRLAERYGISGMAHEWIKSYLHERKQFVSIQSHRSREVEKDCDVPQGSVMGPNFYEDYAAPPTADIFRKHNIEYMIYADDTQAYISCNVDEIGAAMANLEKCLEEIRHWMAHNWLKLNDAKTELIIFCHQKDRLSVPNTTLTLGDCSIPRAKSVKSIGAHLDTELNLEKQISATCKAAWFYLYQIGKIRSYITEDQARTVVHAHVTSRLDCNNSLLVGLPKKQIKRLQLIQNAAARLIKGLKKRDHITPALHQLHWLPIKQRITFKVLLIVYKALHNQGPDYLRELLTLYTPSRSLRSASDCMLIVPKCHYADTERRAFGICAPILWNELPKHIRNMETLGTFKSALKTHLFRTAV
jgi:hypothetical protein